jgi:hypothetical protein
VPTDAVSTADVQPRAADSQRGRAGVLARLRLALGAAGAAVLGAAPHVLHHAGPLAGAALVGGLAGSALFGALGFVLAVPLLWRLRRRTASWRLPAAALGVFVVVFVLSTTVIGPALTDGSDGDSAPGRERPAAGVSPAEHERHHAR